jgi:hypothetical protein
MASVAAVDLGRLALGGGVRIGNWRGRLAMIADDDRTMRRIARV